MIAYDGDVELVVQHEAEGGISYIEFSRARIERSREVLVDRDHLVGVVDVDAEGKPVFIEVLNIDLFPVRLVAAEYGFADQADSVLEQLGRIAATKTPLMRL